MRRLVGLSGSRRDESILGILLVAGVLVATVPTADAGRFAHDLTSMGNRVLLASFSWAFDLHSLARENRELRDTVADLQVRLTQREEAERQNERLRELLEFRQQQPLQILTGAEVIGWGDGRTGYTVTISVGSRAGLERHQAVITADGLVGRIDRVPGAYSAVVSLLHDPANAVAALVEGTRDQGIFQFIDGQGRLTGVLQRSQVAPGDRVLTSGRGGLYPPGLVIGVVTEAMSDPDGVTRRVVVQPSAALDRLEEVFILRR